MAINNPYVPGDPYSYDLKWMVERLNNIKDPEEQAALAKQYAEAAAESEAIASEKATEAGNAKTNADTAAAIASQAQNVATAAATEARTYANNIADPVGGIVTDWLNDNVTPVGGAVTVDTGLTITGSAADSRRTGLNFRRANSFISAVLSSGPLSWGGLTVTMSDEVMVMSGTTTTAQNINIFNNSSGFPTDIAAGDVLNIAFPHTNSNLSLKIFSYVNGSWQYEYNFYGQTVQYAIPATATGLLIRLCLPSGVNGAGTAAVYLCKTQMNYEYEKALPIIAVSEGNNEEPVIERYLAKYGGCYLTPGTHKVAVINMPDNSCIYGSGADSKLQPLTTSQHLITVGSSCTIKNIFCDGLHASIPAESATKVAAINIVGNGDSAPFKNKTIIDGVRISGFYYGINGNNTGYWCANGASISNCYITKCRQGISFNNKCEYNVVTGCTVYGCYAGCINDAGNNLFVGCHFTENTIGFYITADAVTNNGHGSCVGCTFNHPNNNSGYGVLIKNCVNGFTFTGCQFWYAQIYIDESAGIVVSDSILGGTNLIISNWGSAGGALMLSNNMFKSDPTINVQNPIILINNYKFDGTLITQ